MPSNYLALLPIKSITEVNTSFQCFIDFNGKRELDQKIVVPTHLKILFKSNYVQYTEALISQEQKMNTAETNILM